MRNMCVYVHIPNVEGMPPYNKFALKSMRVMSVSWFSDVGMLPTRFSPAKFTALTLLDTHVSPVHAGFAVHGLAASGL